MIARMTVRILAALAVVLLASLSAHAQQAAPSQDVTANGINILEVAADGTLTEVPSSPTHLPVPNLVRPQGVAAL